MQSVTGLLNVFSLTTALAVAGSALALQQFGSAGMDGRSGQTGRSGRSGSPLVVTAQGTPASYDLRGEDGSNGGPGEQGDAAWGCFQPTPDYNVFGAAGGDGGSGGSGGSGGNGGSITAYFTDISALRAILVRSTPGRGGSGNWGGRGGDGCRCTQSTWTNTVGGSPQTFFCNNGRDGNNGYSGSNGSNGSYGSITLISQLTAVPPEKPSVTIDMSQMLAGPIDLSKNHWESRRGARQLFAAGSDIADNYNFFLGRTEVRYSFVWEAARPVSDFRGWQMQLRMEGAEPKLYLPNGLWTESEKIINGNEYTFVFKGAVSTGELGNLQFKSLGGIGADHVVAVKDNAGVSDVLRTTVKLKYYTAENGSYRVRFEDEVPQAALSTAADGFQIAMGELGLNPDWLKRGTQAYVGLTITRALGTNSTAYTMGTYYTITFSPAVGMLVQAANDASLYSGNQIVGRVSRGDQFKVAAVQGNWISLKKLDDTAVRGWIASENLEATP